MNILDIVEVREAEKYLVGYYIRPQFNEGVTYCQFYPYVLNYVISHEEKVFTTALNEEVWGERFIKRSRKPVKEFLDSMRMQISLDTMGIVTHDTCEFYLVMNPNNAKRFGWKEERTFGVEVKIADFIGSDGNYRLPNDRMLFVAKYRGPALGLDRPIYSALLLITKRIDSKDLSTPIVSCPLSGFLIDCSEEEECDTPSVI